MLFLGTLFFVTTSDSVIDNDIWHLMALFREILRLGYVPYHDTFAYTPTIYPCVIHEWGAGAIAYFLAHFFGGTGIHAFISILVFFIAFFIVRCNQLRKSNLLIFFLLIPIAIALGISSFKTFRAQIYSYFFFSLFLYFIELDRRGNRTWIEYWIPCYILWVNLHAGFLLGLILWCMYVAERWIKKSYQPYHIYLILFMIVGIVMNPYHIHFYPYLFHAILMKRPYIEEWNSLWTNKISFTIFMYSLCILFYSLKEGVKQKWNFFFAIIVWSILTLLSQRIIIFYAIIWISLLPSMLLNMKIESILISYWQKMSKILLLIFFFSFIILLCRFIYSESWRIIVPNQKIEKLGKHLVYPVGIKEYLMKYKFEGKIMVDFNVGAYLIWKRYPKIRIAIDSRYEAVYPASFFIEIYDLYYAKGEWQNTLSENKSDVMIVRNDLPIANKMDTLDGWKKVYKDNTFSLYATQNSHLPYEDHSEESFFDTFP